MRIIAIGLGGAGCRIVDSLYGIDRRSSRVACVQGLVVDIDEDALKQLAGIPDTQKIFFPPFDPENPAHPEAGATATIDIAEIVSRIHNLETGENDAIFICCGLGGSMADIVPHVITGLRASSVDPIFGLVTLPCLAEGAKRSGKAADDIDILSPLLDGMILFDNETWYKKTKAEMEKSPRKDKGIAEILGFGRNEPEISPELATYNLLNEAIVRRISLILKAGEFRADGGIDLAEVVLDSGEVLNTMKGMGFITIGYAVEKLSSSPLAFLSQLKPAGLFSEENKKKASRIVELAKQAIYHEISTPCDMTSAHKALVLVAGPSHELSMQGFMTVRKWIDRSIRGLETRSGDYPVMNTKNVAIIIMLSGLENIPRVTELREIREQARHGPSTVPGSYDDSSVFRSAQDTGSLRDEMIVLPKTMQKRPADHNLPKEENPPTERPPAHAKAVKTPPREPLQQPLVPPPAPVPDETPRSPPVRESVHTEKISSVEHGHTGVRQVAPQPAQHPSTRSERISPADRQMPQQPVSNEPAKPTPPVSRGPAGAHAKDLARQRIEQELQRQRMMALSKSSGKNESPTAPKPPSSTEMVRPKREIIHKSSISPGINTPSLPKRESEPGEPVKKTVIVRKRTLPSDEQKPSAPEIPQDVLQGDEIQESPDLVPQEPGTIPEPEPVEIKDPSFKAKDDIFSGKSIRSSAGPKVRDSSLLHTNLKIKKPAERDDPESNQIAADEQAADDATQEQQKGKKIKKRDDISWI